MTSVRKQEYAARMTELLNSYSRILVVSGDNVGSKQVQDIRVAIRGKAILLCGKNTMMRRVLRIAGKENPDLLALLPLMVGNVSLVFTNEALTVVADLISGLKVPAPARAGAIAQVNVTVPAGPTGMEPTMTSFLQALNIASKIAKGQIEIIKDVELLVKGEKVGSSEATLLEKLGIMPFAYGMVLVAVFDNGVVFGADVLEMDDKAYAGIFTQAISSIAAIALATSSPSQAAFPHLIINGVKNLVAAALACDNYTFEQADTMKKILENPGAFAVAAPAAGGAPAAAAAPVEEEESDEEMGFGLFD